MTKRYTLDDFARLFDHTNLQPDATDADMRKLCDEALENHFCMVAINSGQSARCHAMLEGTDIHVGALRLAFLSAKLPLPARPSRPRTRSLPARTRLTTS